MRVKKLFTILLFVLIMTGCIGELETPSYPNISTKIHKETIIIETTPITDTAPITKTAIASQPITEKREVLEYDGILTAHFLDVGQGDSIFIELPDEKTILIDAGESGESETIVNYVKNIGYERIDFLIATHPHSDHIGGMSEVMKNFSIGKLYISPATHTTKTFENFLDTIAEGNIDTLTTYAGDIIHENNDLTVKVLAPENNNYDNINNASVVIYIKFGLTGFLFMGDGEKEEEFEIKNPPECDLLKVGHHGSGTSSSESFIRAVKPKYAVISSGINNSYGHPSEEVLERLTKNNAKIYRTDLSGTVIFVSDGNAVLPFEEI